MAGIKEKGILISDKHPKDPTLNVIHLLKTMSISIRVVDCLAVIINQGREYTNLLCQMPNNVPTSKKNVSP